MDPLLSGVRNAFANGNRRSSSRRAMRRSSSVATTRTASPSELRAPEYPPSGITAKDITAIRIPLADGGFIVQRVVQPPDTEEELSSEDERHRPTHEYADFDPQCPRRGPCSQGFSRTASRVGLDVPLFPPSGVSAKAITAIRYSPDITDNLRQVTNSRVRKRGRPAKSRRKPDNGQRASKQANERHLEAAEEIISSIETKALQDLPANAYDSPMAAAPELVKEAKPLRRSERIAGRRPQTSVATIQMVDQNKVTKPRRQPANRGAAKPKSGTRPKSSKPQQRAGAKGRQGKRRS